MNELFNNFPELVVCKSHANIKSRMLTFHIEHEEKDLLQCLLKVAIRPITTY